MPHTLQPWVQAPIAQVYNERLNEFEIIQDAVDIMRVRSQEHSSFAGSDTLQD